MILSEALPIAEKLKAELAPFCSRIEIAGSIRRKKPEVKDIEIVCVLKDANDVKFWMHLLQKYYRIKGSPGGKYMQIFATDKIIADGRPPRL